ncbi:MAG: hypothetical protein U0R70_10345 [Solirubrobacteraceae bacterium]
MSQPLDTGVLMAARFGLADGPPVRLRLARPSDRAGVTQLLQRRGIAPTSSRWSGCCATIRASGPCSAP